LSTLNILVESKQIKVTKRVQKKLPKVYIDTERVQLVLDNIINNAIKFTPANGRIDISASLLGGDVLVDVRNSGTGIPSSDLKKVFEKYYQVKSGQGENIGGSGLGLVICKNIIESLGGRIWCESEPGKGTSFKFTLPTKKNEIGGEGSKNGSS
jgi:two-component system sensor histidine kinase VicK